MLTYRKFVKCNEVMETFHSGGKRKGIYMSHRINHSQRAKHLSAGVDQFRQVLSFWQLLEPWY